MSSPPLKKLKVGQEPVSIEAILNDPDGAYSHRQVIDAFLRERERNFREREECLHRFDSYVRVVESTILNALHGHESDDDEEEEEEGGQEQEQEENTDNVDIAETDDDREEHTGSDNGGERETDTDDDKVVVRDEQGVQEHGLPSDDKSDNDEVEPSVLEAKKSEDGSDDGAKSSSNSDSDSDSDWSMSKPVGGVDPLRDCSNPSHARLLTVFEEIKHMFRLRVSPMPTWGKTVPSALAPFHAAAAAESETATGIPVTLLPPSSDVSPLASSIATLARYMNSDQCRRVIVMSGAGISVAAGIPDFRSPGTGLYHNLEKYNLPEPEAVFDIAYFRTNPDPFYMLAKEMWPDQYAPTLAHRFVRELERRNKLLRNYTQNIDTLERQAGISAERLVEAHGSFGEAECIDCKAPHSSAYVRERIWASERPLCQHCESGLVKPCITFFGESLPKRFKEKFIWDFPQADLLLVIGTSLQVQPFSLLVNRVPRTTPRVLINLKTAGLNPESCSLLGIEQGFDFGPTPPSLRRDIFLPGDCQETIALLLKELDWSV